MRRTWGLLLVITLLTLAACSDTSDADTGKGFVAGQPGVTRVPVAERQPAPVAQGTTLDEEQISTDAYAGKVVVINVWGSWCAPCRKEAPDLVAAAEETADKAQFIGLNTRDLDRAPANAFVRAFDISYPSIYDPSGSELLKYADHLPPGAIPSTLVIDAEGRVAARVIGPISKGSLVQLVNDVAAGR
ncbi:TlpA family protein disulfide reductase [Propionibacteriaceae bacterium Y1685]|uniref:TlpA family protein disulfide reductase n=1 Tax=Microlunatus sp. Y1700 TaxID=3418487 RepID=UPI003B8142BF